MSFKEEEELNWKQLPQKNRPKEEEHSVEELLHEKNDDDATRWLVWMDVPQFHRRRIPLEGVGVVPIVEFTQPSPSPLWCLSFLPVPKCWAVWGKGIWSQEIKISFWSFEGSVEFLIIRHSKFL